MMAPCHDHARRIFVRNAQTALATCSIEVGIDTAADAALAFLKTTFER